MNKQRGLVSYLIFMLLVACQGPVKQESSKEEPVVMADSLAAVFHANTSSQPDWPDREELIVQILSDPDNLHPTNGRSANRAHAVSLLHATLVAPDLAERSFKPYLAESMPTVSEDKRTYTYKLREGVHFDDGEALRARDVVFSIKANKCALVSNQHFKSQLSLLESVQALNEKSVQITYSEPYAKNLSVLADLPILQQSLFDPTQLLDRYSIEQLADQEALKEEDALNEWASFFNHPELGTDPSRITGLGPYKLASWQTGSRLVFDKKKQHWNSAPKHRFEQAVPEAIVFKIVSDPNALMLEIKNQLVDATLALPKDILESLANDPEFQKNYHLDYLPSYAFSFMALNLQPDGEKRARLFNDPVTRKAMAYLVNADMIVQQLSKGHGYRIASPVSIIKPSHNDLLEPYAYNLAKGKELLKEAGWADSDQNGTLDKEIDGKLVELDFGIAYNARAVAWKDAASIIQAGLEPAGVKVRLEPLDGPAYAAALQSTHDFDAILLTLSADFSPDDFSQVFHSSNYPQGFNFSGYQKPGVDSLLDQINITLAENERKPLLDQLQAILYEDLPWIYLTTGAKGIVVHKRLQNSAVFSSLPGFRAGSMQPPAVNK